MSNKEKPSQPSRNPLFDLPLEDDRDGPASSPLFGREETRTGTRTRLRQRFAEGDAEYARSTQSQRTIPPDPHAPRPPRPAPSRQQYDQPVSDPETRTRRARRLFDDEDSYEDEYGDPRPRSNDMFDSLPRGGRIGPPSRVLAPPVMRGGSAGEVLLLVLIAAVSLFIIFALWPGGVARISQWPGALQQAVQNMTNSIANPFNEEPAPPGDYRLRAPPSLTAAQVDSILASYGSPATGTGQVWVDLGREYQIDPAFAVAFFVHESTAGTHPGWAGLKDDGTTTHNVGNIICAGYATCYGRFRDYASWEEGIKDWYRLISVEYIDGRGTETVAEIIPIYAPAFENDVDQYVTVVEQMVDRWRNGVIVGEVGSDAPVGNPLNHPATVMTQGYGSGTHAPANIWGAIDLALDSNGDGAADPAGTWDQPIFATHSGVVKLTPNSYPAGNHIWVMNQNYKTGYAHLSSFAVDNGQMVDRGTLIGYVGSTGQSSGPHLDYQIWRKEGGIWVNVNPLSYGALQALN